MVCMGWGGGEGGGGDNEGSCKIGVVKWREWGIEDSSSLVQLKQH